MSGLEREQPLQIIIVADINQLPTSGVSIGSLRFSLSDNCIYYFNYDNTWTKLLTNSSPNFTSYSGSIQTPDGGDGSDNNRIVLSIPFANLTSNHCHITIAIIGVDNADAASYFIEALIKRVNETVSIVSSTDSFFHQGILSGIQYQLIPNETNLDIKVIGLAQEAINWTCKADILTASITI